MPICRQKSSESQKRLFVLFEPHKQEKQLPFNNANKTKETTFPVSTVFPQK